MDTQLSLNINTKIKETFRRRIITWGNKHFRTFPWREPGDPYKLLIAEIMLHRTQVKQVINIYNDFIERFPDIYCLADTSDSELQKYLKSLGLKWRINLFNMMVSELVARYNGIVPEEKPDLLSLPGVGPYIAGAIRCFAYGHSDAIIDTNIMRIITRVFNIPFKDSLRRNSSFVAFSQSLVDPDSPECYHYGLLDLAALICRPEFPDCKNCPLADICEYRKNQI
jgi:A/G-specific adenine glycosylase